MRILCLSADTLSPLSPPKLSIRPQPPTHLPNPLSLASRPIPTSYKPRRQPSNSHSLTPKPTAHEQQSIHRHRHHRSTPNTHTSPLRPLPTLSPHHLAAHHTLPSLPSPITISRAGRKKTTHPQPPQNTPQPGIVLSDRLAREQRALNRGNLVSMRCLLVRGHVQAEKVWAGPGRDGLGWYLRRPRCFVLSWARYVSPRSIR
jgi:hypothetical protein